MKKFILMFKTCFKKAVMATMSLLVVMLGLVMLISCDSKLFGTDTEETTRSNVSQVIQNEPVVLAETRVNTPYGVKNENGVKTTIINSGRVCSQLEVGGLYDSDALNYTLGNVIVSSTWLYDETSFDYYEIFEIQNVIVDFNFMFSTQAEQAWNEFQGSYCDSIAIYGFKDKFKFSEFLELVFHNIVEKNADIDIFYTDYTWYEFDLIAPTIGGSVHASVDVDNQPSIDEIISHVYAYDETDGYVPILVESSTYVQGVMEVGDYAVNIYALDSALNRNDTIIYVHRYDWTAPVINGTDTYDLNYDNDLTLAKIESALTITDNVDSGLKLEKVSDTFTGNEHKIGNYQVVYRTIDYSNNMSANKTINIAVKNEGTATIGGARVIEVGTNEVLTLAEFKSCVSVVDGYDGVITNYTITGFDDYTATSKVVGTNIVKVSYTNSGNNTAVAEFSIVKKDKLAPGFLFDDYFIQLKQGEVFTLDMIMNQVALILNLDVAQIESVNGEYDVMTLGNYGIDVCLATGEKKAFTLSVVDEFGNAPSDKLTTKDFLSAEGYVDNLFKPTNWNVYHYLTILGVVLLVSVGIAFCIVHKRKKDNQNNMYY